MFSYLISLKKHSPGVLSVKLLVPSAFEIDGIHQDQLSQRTDCPCPQYLWYLTCKEHERKLLLLGENKLFFYKSSLSLNIEKRLEFCLLAVWGLREMVFHAVHTCSVVGITINRGKFWRRGEYQTTWPASWDTCMQVRKQQLEVDMEQQTGSQ